MLGITFLFLLLSLLKLNNFKSEGPYEKSRHANFPNHLNDTKKCAIANLFFLSPIQETRWTQFQFFSSFFF